MVLSVTSGDNGIIQRATFLAFGDTLDHTGAWSLGAMTAAANEAVNSIASLIWRSSSVWQWDDRNHTDLAFATTTLDATKQDYSLPNTVFEVLGVEILDVNGEWQRLDQVDPSSERGLQLLSAGNTAGMPRFYDLVGNSIVLDRLPTAAACTLTAGLKLTYTRETTTFTAPATYTTSDTTQPGFDEAFHRLVPLMMAYDWCIPNGSAEQCQKLLNEITSLNQMLVSHFGRKNADSKFGIRVRRESYK